MVPCSAAHSVSASSTLILVVPGWEETSAGSAADSHRQPSACVRLLPLCTTPPSSTPSLLDEVAQRCTVRSKRCSLFLCQRPRCILSVSLSLSFSHPQELCHLVLDFGCPAAPCFDSLCLQLHSTRAGPPPSRAPPSWSRWTRMDLTLPLELAAVAEGCWPAVEGGGTGRRRTASWRRRRRRVLWWSVVVAGVGWGLCG
jgi:hypothetical protein